MIGWNKFGQAAHFDSSTNSGAEMCIERQNKDILREKVVLSTVRHVDWRGLEVR